VGLYRQPNTYSCGPFALKHALVALGRLADEQAIGKVANPHWWGGTDEVKLARAARAFGCDLPLVRRTDEDRAWYSLTRALDSELPVILCVDDWMHWLTVARHEGGRFVVIDSNEEPVLTVMTWPQLRNRWKYVEEGEPRALYDLHVVKPRERAPARARFSVARAQFLRRPENKELAEHWDEYLGDLMEICRPRSPRITDALSMAEFLRRHQSLLVSRTRFWHGQIEREEVGRILRNFRFVAETYGLVIPAAGQRRALVDLGMLLAMWSASARGIGDMYGAAAERTRAERRARGHGYRRPRRR
jgi:hypothetical protein